MGSFRVRVRVRFWLGPTTQLDLTCMSSFMFLHLLVTQVEHNLHDASKVYVLHVVKP